VLNPTLETDPAPAQSPTARRVQGTAPTERPPPWSSVSARWQEDICIEAVGTRREARGGCQEGSVPWPRLEPDTREAKTAAATRSVPSSLLARSYTLATYWACVGRLRLSLGPALSGRTGAGETRRESQISRHARACATRLVPSPRRIQLGHRVVRPATTNDRAVRHGAIFRLALSCRSCVPVSRLEHFSCLR
jgi:hypothetical protein